MRSRAISFTTVTARNRLIFFLRTILLSQLQSSAESVQRL